MKTLVIGTGAAGNRAAINLVKCGVMKKEDILLLNSTLTDIPELEEYKDCAKQFSFDENERRGCGKNRTIGASLAIRSIMQKNGIDFMQIVEGYKKVIIVSSLEGGTGSGSSIIIAEHLIRCTDVKIELYLFKGFSKDIMGLQNTLLFFDELDKCMNSLSDEDIRNGKGYRVQIIRNDAFLEETKDELEAQKLANNEFSRRVMLSSGDLLNGYYNNDCNNIDVEDLGNIICSPGYATVEYIDIYDEIVSQEEYNSLIREMIKSTKSFPIEQKSIKNVAIFGNLQKNSRANIDYQQTVLKEIFGDIIDLQDQFYSEANQREFIAIIIGGAELPYNAIETIEKEYNKRKKSINKANKEQTKFNISIDNPLNNSFSNNKLVGDKTSSDTLNNNTIISSPFADMYKNMMSDIEGKNTKKKNQKLDPPNASDY